MTDTAQTAFDTAAARELELFEDLRQLEHTAERYSRLQVEARLQLVDARAAQVEAESERKAAALIGEPFKPKTREVLAVAKTVIAETESRLQALAEELEKISASKRIINDEIMTGRRSLGRLREAAHREAAQLALVTFARALPDGLPLAAVAATLECPVHKLQSFAKG